METLKVDTTKLLSIDKYAEKMGVTRQTVYNWIKWKHVKVKVISDKKFIEIN